MNPLNLDAFSSSGLTGYVMLRDVKHGDNKVGEELVSTGNGRIAKWIDRKRNTTARQEISLNVLSAVRNALLPTYGEANVDTAINTVFGNSVADQVKDKHLRRDQELRRVKAEDIHKILNLLKNPARPADQEAVIKPVKLALTYTASGVKANANGPVKHALSGAFARHVAEIGAALHEADRLLATDPGLGLSKDDAKQKLVNAKRKLQTSLAELLNKRDHSLMTLEPIRPDALENEVLKKLQDDIAQRQQALDELIKDYDDIIDPINRDSAMKCLEHWKSTGKKAIDAYAGRNPGMLGDAAKDRLKEKVADWIKNRMPSNIDPSGNPFDPDKALKNIQKDLKEFLKDSIKLETGQKAKGLGSIVKDCFAKEMNSQPWEKITKDFTFDGKTITSEITPASKIGDANGNKLEYEEGVNGVMSYCTKEAHHAVNLAQTTLKTGDNVIFNAIRHAGHSAYDMEPGPARDTANVARATETVKAAFLSRQDLIEKALANPNEPLVFDMTSVSLLTATNLYGSELTQIRDQEAAWTKINSGDPPITITINRGHGQAPVSITLKPKVTMFTLSGNTAPVITSDLGKSWGLLDGPNKRSFDSFMDRVTLFLETNKTSTDDATKKKCKYIQILQSQLRTIWDSESYKKDAGGCYKASSRVAMLTYLMGDVPCWNCKSGKDRTSMMDAECKYLATLIATDQKIPPPNEKPTRELTRLFRNTVFKTGNLELQRYNTGLSGYKAIERSSSIRSRLGHWFKRAKGASKYVGK